MNTADRSLAMIDYALRRRFSFYEFTPAFSNHNFIEYSNELNSSKFSNLIKAVEEMNKEIMEDSSLGDGFRVGHSYFCECEAVTDEWLLSVIEYELIPLIKEYWFDEKIPLEKWTKKLRGVIND